MLIYIIIIAGYFCFCIFSSEGQFRSDWEIRRIKRFREGLLQAAFGEKIKPKFIRDIVGQDRGLSLLQEILYKSKPQHILIYGPQGVGKRIATRLVFQRARVRRNSFFDDQSIILELEASSLYSDGIKSQEVLGGVVKYLTFKNTDNHAPIRIGQIKPGAVIKAHRGILFIEGIDQLQASDMNWLLEVLESNKVFFKDIDHDLSDKHRPEYIDKIFRDGLTSDFILVATTSKKPDDLPECLRSVCVEIFFDFLTPEEIASIIRDTCRRANLQIREKEIDKIKKYIDSGEECRNLIEILGTRSVGQARRQILAQDIEWLVKSLEKG